MTSDTREVLKRMLENADDAELERIHKRVKTYPRNSCAVQSARAAKWRPKNADETRSTIDLLLCDVGLRVADRSLVFGPIEANMKIVGAEVVDRLRAVKSTEHSHATTVGLSLHVAAIIARAVEEGNRMLAYEKPEGPVVLEKNQRADAPAWGRASARGSGCSFNGAGKVVFTKALQNLRRRVEVCSSSTECETAVCACPVERSVPSPSFQLEHFRSYTKGTRRTWLLT